MMITNHTETYSTYFEQQEGVTWLTEPTPVTVYFYLTGDCKCGLFIPDREKKFAPISARLKISERDYYAWTPQGIYLSDPCYRGIQATLSDMDIRNSLEKLLMPCPPPAARWSQLKLRELPTSHAIEEYRAKLAELYANGSVIIKQFEATDRILFDQCLRSQRPFERSVCQFELFRNGLLNNELPCQSVDQGELNNAEWTYTSCFLLSGTLAQMLYNGGAYKGLAPDHELSLRLAQSAWTDLWGHSYSSLYSVQTGAAWSKWFLDIWCNVTLLSIDIKTMKITCIFATDVD